MIQLPETPAGRVLVVDDDAMNRDMLSRRLSRKGIEVTVAEDGEEALRRIGEGGFDLVLLDIMMPGVDGLQVLERLRRDRPASELPVIMATAKDSSSDVVYALELGANDYVTKPLDFPVVLARVCTQLSLRRANRQLEAAHARMKRDLEAAARIQRSLMPTALPEIDGVRFAYRYEPCDELAGDTLGIFPLDGDRVGLYLVDVSGHGVPAALLSVTLSRVLSPVDEESLLFEPNGPGARTPLAPGPFAARLNARFPMDPETRQYFTLAYGILDPVRRRLRYIAAAHPGPLQVAADGTGASHPPSGLAIGWFPGSQYEERTVALSPGDRLYFLSDGVLEAMDEEEEQFGVDRVQSLLAAARDRDLAASIELLLDEVGHWTGEAGPGDDVSVLALEID